MRVHTNDRVYTAIFFYLWTHTYVKGSIKSNSYIRSVEQGNILWLLQKVFLDL